MLFQVDIDAARKQFPSYTFLKALTPSAQKCAFHVKDANGTDLCLKIISPDYETDRLTREITAMQNISHDNIVKLVEYTFSTKPGSSKHYFVEEFIDGTDLQDSLNEVWDRPRASRVFSALMNGLDALRQSSIVHRDLKPTNIRLRSDDKPVIIDFGLSRHLKLSDLTQTADGAQIGTPIYFAPEQFSGTKHSIDHRTDIFAAGVILYQALLGNHPFYSIGMSRAELQDRVCSGDQHLTTAEFKQLPDKWQLLIKKLLAKERVDRVTEANQAAKILLNLEAV